MTVASPPRSSRGAKGATPERLALAAEAARLREHGFVIRQIAERLEVSHSYAGSLLTDPDGSKARARKDSYSKPCPYCGNAMSGSEGPNEMPRMCSDCSLGEHHPGRIWTRESIIAAIQRWARAHDGLAPTSTEWKRADPINHYPAAACVYPTPFSSWADAIEAAGFARPRIGPTPRSRETKCPRCGHEEVKVAVRSGVLCDECLRVGNRAWKRAYYARHRERVLASQRRYLLANKAKIYAKRKEWRAANRERINAQKRAARKKASA